MSCKIDSSLHENYADVKSYFKYNEHFSYFMALVNKAQFQFKIYFCFLSFFVTFHRQSFKSFIRHKPRWSYKLLIILYIHVYNTAIFFPRFPLDGLVVYIVHIHGFFLHIYGSRVEPHAFTHLSVCSRDREQHDVETGAAWVSKTTYLVVKKTNTRVLSITCH